MGWIEMEPRPDFPCLAPERELVPVEVELYEKILNSAPSPPTEPRAGVSTGIFSSP